MQRIIKNPFGIIETSGLMSWRFFLEKWLVKFFVKDVVVVVEFFVNSLRSCLNFSKIFC
jgi:hypothetical protein